MSLFPKITDGNITTTTTTTEAPEPHVQDEVKYLVVPLVVVILIMLCSALVYLMARKRRLDTMRKNLLNLYEFDSNEQEWEPLSSYDNPTCYNTTSF